MMRLFRAVGLALGALLAVGAAAGLVYAISLLRLWGEAVRATDPFDASEPI
ncbi:MAG TPA: hypothetical protein VNN19_04675 [bacterium]|nr:hypothetical protein [bacterium]